MAYEIFIYGQVTPFQGKDLRDKGFVNLDIVEGELQKAAGDDLLVRLHTPGGSVDEGFAIYTSLRRYAKENNATITTRADGKVSSVGTVIFLSGDNRIGSPYVQPFFHLAWKEVVGNSEEVERAALGLKQLNTQISKFYAQHTNLTEAEAMTLMKEERFLKPELSEALRFSTSTEEIFYPQFLQQYSTKDMNLTESLSRKIKGFFDQEPNNKVLYTAEGSELNFYELPADGIPVKGSKAVYEGLPAGNSNNGEYIMQSGDVFRFSGEELTEIIEKEQVLITENKELLERNAKLESELKNVNGLHSEQNKELNQIKDRLDKATSIIEEFKNLESNINVESSLDERNYQSGGVEFKKRNILTHITI